MAEPLVEPPPPAPTGIATGSVPGQRQPSRRSSGRGLSRGLNRTDAERQAHLDSMRRVVADPELEKLHSWIHTNLIILDSKAQAILGLYSLALAALTVYYSVVAATAPGYVVGAIALGFAIIAWSIIPLARVSYVHWSTTEEFLDPQRMLLDLLRVRDKRTRVIRLSVLKGALTLGIFAFLLFWDISRRLVG